MFPWWFTMVPLSQSYSKVKHWSCGLAEERPLVMSLCTELQAFGLRLFLDLKWNKRQIVKGISQYGKSRCDHSNCFQQAHLCYSATATPAQLSLLSEVIAKYSALRERKREGERQKQQKGNEEENSLQKDTDQFGVIGNIYFWRKKSSFIVEVYIFILKDIIHTSNYLRNQFWDFQNASRFSLESILF